MNLIAEVVARCSAYGGIALATLIYLIIDIYPAVKSFEAMARTPAFWVLWLVFTVLNLIAWGVLQVAAAAKIAAMLPPNHQEITSLVLVVLSTLCTLTILQSFTVKIADMKFLDLAPVVDRFRKTALEAVSGTVAQLQRVRDQELIAELAKKYSADCSELREAFKEVMAFAGDDTAKIAAQLTAIQEKCEIGSFSFARELALRIVKADDGKARAMIASR